MCQCVMTKTMSSPLGVINVQPLLTGQCSYARPVPSSWGPSNWKVYYRCSPCGPWSVAQVFVAPLTRTNPP